MRACPSTVPSWEAMNKCFLRAIEFIQCIEVEIKFNRLVNSFDIMPIALGSKCLKMGEKSRAEVA